MANSVAAASKYLAMLDKAYKAAARSSVLDVNPAWVREGDVAGTFYLSELSLVGLGTYSTATGFPIGDVTQSWQSYTYAQDRARTFSVDKVEDSEGADLAFASIAGEFERRYVAPEIDAHRFAAIATGAGTDVADTLSTSDASEWVTALNLGLNTLDEAEVDDDNKVLFITAGGLRLVKNQASTAATTDALDRSTVVVVPQTRFYTAVTMDAGATGSAGGYARATGAEEINFILMDKFAAFADAKHVALRKFAPEVNQTADAYKYDFRVVHDCWVRHGRSAGIYVHTKDATAS